MMPVKSGPQDGIQERKQSEVSTLKPEGQQKKWAKRYRTEIAASSASVLSTSAAFPVDSIKTRMQTYK